MKRNVIEKFERVMQLREQYASQIESLGQEQYAITCNVARELGLKEHQDYRNYFRCESVQVEEDGRVGMYEYDRCDHRNDHIDSFSIHPLILSGDSKGYDTLLRTQMQEKAVKLRQWKEKEAIEKKVRLEAEIHRMQEQLQKLNS